MADTNDKKLVIEVLLAMYRENVATARHYETQRSTATGIYTSLCAALIAFVATRWQERGDIDLTFLPFAVFLILLGVSGFLMVMKTFERSMVGRTLAEAYMNTVKKLVEPDAKTLFGERVHQIEYIENAKELMESSSIKPYDFVFLAGKRFESEKALKKFYAALENPNPMEPRTIALPIHNAVTKLYGITWPRLSQKRLWTFPYFAFVAFGLILGALSVRHSIG
jgi:hypothetical protein